MRLETVSNALHRLMLGIFFLLMGLGLLFGVLRGGYYALAFVLAAVIVLLMYVLIPCRAPGPGESRKPPPGGSLLSPMAALGGVKLCVLLSVLCFAVKFLWVFFVRIEPQVDYATFYNYAVYLADTWRAFSRYVALFPHILGYSTFLSLFIRIFGENPLLAPALNVLLSVLSGVMLFQIARRLLDLRAAALVYLLWIAAPSQTMYNSIVLSEPLYTTLLIGFFLLLTQLDRKPVPAGGRGVGKMAGWGGLAGVILCAVNACRPIGAILMIAVLIWLFVLKASDWKNAAFRWGWGAFLLLLAAVYVVGGALWNQYCASRVVEEPAGFPGYNILVGFNQESGGRWNLEDSELLGYYSEQPGSTAPWVQEQMLGEAVTRITSGGLDFSQLFRDKLSTFLSTDTGFVLDNHGVLSHPSVLTTVCNVFYYAILLLSMGGALRMMRSLKPSAASLFPLYVVGLTLAHMLVEVAVRYHYSILPPLLITALYPLFPNRETHHHTDGAPPAPEKG